MKFATLIVSFLIVIAVLIPGPNLPDVSIGGFDKVFHIAMFGLWAVAVQYDFRTRQVTFWAVILTGILFSVITELLQLLVAGRSYDLYDMVADLIGLVAGFFLGGKIVKLLRKTR